MERVPVDFTNELMEDLHKYARIAAADVLNNGKGNEACLYVADEAVASLCLRWVNNPPKATERTEGFYFISVKNSVINEVNKQLNTKKRQMYNDVHGVQLDKPYQGMTLELLDESTEEDYIDMKDKYNDDIDSKLAIIVEALTESPYIEEIDFEIFRMRYLEGHTLKHIAEVLGYSTSHIYVRHKRVKNVINHLADSNSF